MVTLIWAFGLFGLATFSLAIVLHRLDRSTHNPAGKEDIERGARMLRSQKYNFTPPPDVWEKKKPRKIKPRKH